MKTKILPVIFLSLTNVISQNVTATTEDKFEIKKYSDAVDQILSADPSTLKGDIARELCTNLLAGSIVSGFLWDGSKDVNGLPLLSPYANICQDTLYLTLRVLFDKKIRKTSTVDDALDVLLSAKKSKLSNLGKANINLHSLKSNINTIGKKTEWARWIYRILINGGLKIHWRLLKALFNAKEDPKFAAAASSIAILYWYSVVMQSATWKNASRKKKLKELENLLNQAKTIAANTKAIA